MNNLQAAKALDRVFSSVTRKFNKRTCIFIDGDWGIGKTTFIENYFSENEDKYDVIYTSVFGKNSVRDIEKSILIHSLPGLKKINEDNGWIRVAKTFVNDVSDKFLGVSVDNYINSFSIEDIKWDTIGNKHTIICFDDIERKADSIKIKNLLGLVERTKKNFDVLIIGNLNELNEEDSEDFDRYKEKVVDSIIKIDNTHKSTLSCILKSMKIEGRKEIVDVYLSDNTAFGKAPSSRKTFMANKIHNLRVFTKYVELILNLEEYIEPYKVDEGIFKMCKAVIYDYYFPDKDAKKSSMNFDKYNIYKAINKILLNEDIKKDDFLEYFVANAEVRKDINSLYNAYRFNEKELENIIKKIEVKIEVKDLEYFIKQENVISVVSALRQLKKSDNDMIKKIFKIALDLYLPEKYIPHIKIKYLQFNDFDNYGNEIECDKLIQGFIEKLNQRCEEKFRDFVNNKLEKEKQKITKNYEELMKLYNVIEINNIEEFEDIFDYYFEQLAVNYSDETAKKIDNLISNTNSNLICKFFINRIKNETQITRINKYEHFDFELERKMQNEAEADDYIE